MDLIKYYTVMRTKIYHFHVKKTVQIYIHVHVNARVLSVSRLLLGHMGSGGLAMSSYMYIVSCYRQKYIFFESTRNRLIWTRSSVLSCPMQYDIVSVFCGQLANHFYRNTLDGAMHKFIINKQSIIYFVAIQ